MSITQIYGFEFPRAPMWIPATILQGAYDADFDSHVATLMGAARVAMQVPHYGSYLGIMVGQFRVKFVSLPTTQEFFFKCDGNYGTSYYIGYNPSTGKLCVKIRNGSSVEVGWTDGPAINVGQVYRIGFRFDSLTTHNVLDWEVDGVAGPTLALDSTSGPGYDWLTLADCQAASGSGFAYTIQADDFVFSDDEDDYPLDDLTISLLLPIEDGVANDPLNRVRRDDSAVDVSHPAYAALASDGGRYMKQTVVDTDAYREVVFDDIPAGRRPAAVKANVGALNSANASANHIKALLTVPDFSDLVLFNGGTFQFPSDSFPIVYGISTVGDGLFGYEWTSERVNGLRGRLGYSSDINPSPDIDFFWLEVAHAPNPPDVIGVDPEVTRAVGIMGHVIVGPSGSNF